MRIVIDLQATQSRSRLREAGQYALAAALSIARDRGEHQVVVALNGLFPDGIEAVRAAFDGVLPQEDIRIWHAPGPVREGQPGNDGRRETAELIREAFLAALQPSVVFVPSFFEGFDDDGVTSIGRFAPDLLTVVAVADGAQEAPVPDDDRLRAFHARKRLQLRQASHLLSMSDGGDLVQALEAVAGRVAPALAVAPEPRPRLAFLSPLPPERCGIAVYCAELIPHLARHYEIDLIVEHAGDAEPSLRDRCTVRDTSWFLAHRDEYARVLYHIGNSPHHRRTLDLMVRVPGVVVLHDFGLGDLFRFLETHDSRPHLWTRALYASHGYEAVAQRFRGRPTADLAEVYPANMEVLQHATGVIVHSEHARRLAARWYGDATAESWRVVPLLWDDRPRPDRARARQALGLGEGDFLVCCFGLLGPTKLNHRLLRAWLQSRLAGEPSSRLVFVGENERNEYGASLIRALPADGRIRITGWVDDEEYDAWMAACDLAVQLRTRSRGETSRSVLDCLGSLVATIVNAHATLAELPRDAVRQVPDAFSDRDLVEALESLWTDEAARHALGSRGQALVEAEHGPAASAGRYALAIERFHAAAGVGTRALIQAIGSLRGGEATAGELRDTAVAVALSEPRPGALPHLLLDVSATARRDLRTGIQRMARGLLAELLQHPPAGCRVEPIMLSDQGGQWHYRYARTWTLRLLGLPSEWAADEPVHFAPGDRLLAVDFCGDLLVQAEAAGVHRALRDHGVGLYFTVFDLLPLLRPEFFPPHSFGFAAWLEAVARVADGAVCISRSVASELSSWLSGRPSRRLRPLDVSWFHPGGDVQATCPTAGLPDSAASTLERLAAAPTFLMVGTVEPRKGYLQALRAFSRLWREGADINLVVLGGEGWRGLPDSDRRTIPQIVSELRHHPEAGRRLFWLHDASDEYLERVYAASTCLLVASEGEGFGLPLIEAARHGLPVIARDLPVFREVGGDGAWYFSGLHEDDLAAAVTEWLALWRDAKHPRSTGNHRLTWRESAAALSEWVLKGGRRRAAPTRGAMPCGSQA